MKRTVHYIFEEPVSGVKELKVTVGTLTLQGLGQHAKLASAYRLHFRTLAGVQEGEALDAKRFEQIDEDLRFISNYWQRWARIRSATVGLQAKAEEGDWFECEWKNFGWENVDNVQSIPADLFEALDEAAIRVNPRVFGIALPEDGDPNAPKVGVVSLS